MATDQQSGNLVHERHTVPTVTRSKLRALHRASATVQAILPEHHRHHDLKMTRAGGWSPCEPWIICTSNTQVNSAEDVQ